MKLRNRIFALSFTTSVLLLGAASAAGFLLRADGDAASRERTETALASLETLASGDGPEAALVREALAPLRRDAARRSILSQDRTVADVAAIALFVGAGALASFAVSAAAASMMTARWERVREGIAALGREKTRMRFGTGSDDEFGALENELDRLLDALDDRERMKSELKALQGWGEAAAFLSHQAKTPLASLVLSARTMREALADPDAGEAAAEAAARAERDAARLSALFSRVRSLSGFGEPEPVPVDPHRLLLEAAAAASARFGGIRPEAISFRREGPDTLPLLDPNYLREAFVNLLQNSAEACERQGRPFSASLVSRRLPAGHELEYGDPVEGLDPGLADRVGTPRFSTKPDGTGLGVWLVGRIAALHGGSMSVRLGPSGGLVFLLSFPRAAAAQAGA